jgi:probable rRNA maturation factor
MFHYSIEISQQLPTSDSDVDHVFVDEVIRRVLQEEKISTAKISVAIVSDAEIHRVNREFLGHDYPTDVVSFLLNDPMDAKAGIDIDSQSASDVNALDNPDDAAELCDFLNGELIVSFETAIREAHAHGWSPRAELLLYIVHGLLHLCGYDDLTDEARPLMRKRERELLGIWGLCPTGLEM